MYRTKSTPNIAAIEFRQDRTLYRKYVMWRGGGGVKGGTKWRKCMKTRMFLFFHVNFKHESTKHACFHIKFRR